MSTAPDAAARLEARKRVAAWSARSRKLRDAFHHAGRSRAEAMFDCLNLGIPIVTVAADAEVDVSFVSRAVRDWCERNNRDRPDPSVYSMRTTPTAATAGDN